MGVRNGVELHSAAETRKTLDESSHSRWSEDMFDLPWNPSYSVRGYSKCWTANDERSKDKELLGNAVDICEPTHPAKMEGISLGLQHNLLALRVWEWILYSVCNMRPFPRPYPSLKLDDCVACTMECTPIKHRFWLRSRYAMYDRHATPLAKSTPDRRKCSNDERCGYAAVRKNI